MSWIVKNNFLSMSEMQNNAREFWKYFIVRGWTLNAICGMLGNIQTESNINPGIWENLDEGNLNNGYGLVQWTPATKYINWAGSNYSSGDKQCERIEYEVANGIQWYATPEYPMTFEEFKVSKLPPDYLAMVFIANYERPFDTNQPIRGEQALYWWDFLEGGTPPEPSEGDYILIKPYIYPFDDSLFGRKILSNNKKFKKVTDIGDMSIITDGRRTYNVFKKYLKKA